MKKIGSILAVMVMLLVSSVMLAGCFGGGDGNYKVKIETCQHGIITVDKSSAKEGEKVEVTAIAETGYELVVITCDGVVLSSTSVTMPKHDITLSALFKASGSQGGTGSEEELINLNLGTYVCQIEYDVEVDDEWGYFKPSYYFNTITFKAGNKVDVNVYMSSENIPGNMYSLENIIYTREGNTLSATAFDYTATVKIIDENNIAVILKGEADDTILVMTRKEEIRVVDGAYKGNVWNDYQSGAYQALTLTFNGGNVDVKFVYCDGQSDEQVMVSGSAEYTIRGNRMFVSVSERKFCARVRIEDGYIVLCELSEIDENGMSYVHDNDDWVYLYQQAA